MACVTPQFTPGEGWWGGETHVHRPAADAELLMRADDLAVARVISWWNRTNPWLKQTPPAPQPVGFDGTRSWHALGGEDERDGGALLFLDWCRDRAAQLQALANVSESQRNQLVQPWLEAIRFWEDRQP